MDTNRYDRDPGLTTLKYQWARVLLKDNGVNQVRQKIKAVKQYLIQKNPNSPGIAKRKPTLKEFCEYHGLPIDSSSYIINNRYLERIIIPDGPYKNQSN